MPDPTPPPPLRLLDRVRAALRTRHYSLRTEKVYVGWIRRYIPFHGKRHPAEMGPDETTRFLSDLAIQRNVAASTQNQALSALLFLYREVLEQALPWLDDIVRAKTRERIPVVLTREEVRAVIDALDGPTRLPALLLYGAGLRLLEALRLRVQDVDFARNQITVRSGKGDKDRVTMLPTAASRDLAKHLETIRDQHAADLLAGAGWVELPWALARKYPRAGREWIWQWIFPATRTYLHRETNQRRRHHLHESVLQRAVKEAVRSKGIPKRATCHTFRHSPSSTGVPPASSAPPTASPSPQSIAPRHSRSRKCPGLCKTERAPRDNAHPRVPKRRSRHIAPAISAGLSAPGLREGEVCRPGYF